MAAEMNRLAAAGTPSAPLNQITSGELPKHTMSSLYFQQYLSFMAIFQGVLTAVRLVVLCGPCISCCACLRA